MMQLISNHQNIRNLIAKFPHLSTATKILQKLQVDYYKRRITEIYGKNQAACAVDVLYPKASELYQNPSSLDDLSCIDQINQEILLFLLNQEYSARFVTNLNIFSDELSDKYRSYGVLFDFIGKMKDYSDRYVQIDPGKSATIRSLANELKAQVIIFGLQTNKTIEAFEDFEQQFMTNLHSQDELMKSEGPSWDCIVKNIGVALTLVGALYQAGDYLWKKFKGESYTPLFYGSSGGECAREGLEHGMQALKTEILGNS